MVLWIFFRKSNREIQTFVIIDNTRPKETAVPRQFDHSAQKVAQHQLKSESKPTYFIARAKFSAAEGQPTANEKNSS